MSPTRAGKQSVDVAGEEQRAQKLREDLRRTSLHFLDVDLDLAMTLAGIASGSSKDARKRARNQEMSRRAYDSVLQLSERLELSKEDQTSLKEKLSRLKSMLRKLGETF